MGSSARLTRIPSLKERLDDAFTSNRDQILLFLARIEGHGKGMLQRHEILSEFEAIPPAERQKLSEGPFAELLRSTQEAVVSPPSIAFALCPRPGVCEYIRVNKHGLALEQLTASEFLHLKEHLVDASLKGNIVLELDFEPLNASFPKPTLSKSIGNGVELLNRHLSPKPFHDKESLHQERQKSEGPSAELLRSTQEASVYSSVYPAVQSLDSGQRIEGHGKGMLEHPEILSESEAIPPAGRQKSEGPSAELPSSTQEASVYSSVYPAVQSLKQTVTSGLFPASPSVVLLMHAADLIRCLMAPLLKAGYSRILEMAAILFIIIAAMAIILVDKEKQLFITIIIWTCIMILILMVHAVRYV